MLPGPTTSQLRGSLAVGARLSVYRGRTATVVDLPVKEVVLDATGSRTVRRQLSFTAPKDYVPSSPLDPVNNFGHRVHCWAVSERPAGQRIETDLGWFLIEDWDESTDGILSVTAVDLNRLIETDVAPWPSSPPKGQRLKAELQRLAGAQIPVVLDSQTDPLVDAKLQFKTDRLANLADLAASHGLDFGMKPDGYLHFWPINDRIVATYSADDLILDAPRKSQKRRANRYLAVGSKTDTVLGPDGKPVKDAAGNQVQKETRWSFEAKLTEPPFDDAYGIIRDRIEVQSATSQVQVTNAANQAQRAGASVLGQRSFLIVPDPRLEYGDIAMFIAPDGYVKGRVVAFSLPVDKPAKERVDVEIIG